jgi:16S rRNA (cytidine1402-2'-O)-methyltransferase
VSPRGRGDGGAVRGSAKEEDARQSGVLWVVATPIGNLEDITLRALRVLREADAVLAEDTRTTRKLLERHGISTPLRTHHAHSSEGSVARMVEELRAGARLALVTDAGTPLVSDPGAALVSAAAAAGVRVEPVPGPSATLAAISVAGVRADGFRFVGFLPRAGGRRRAALRRVADDPLTTVLFEAPPRTARTLADLAAACGEDRPAALCRELTKAFEEVARGTLADLARRAERGVRGEVTIVVEGRRLSPRSDAATDAEAHAPAEPTVREACGARDVEGADVEDVDVDGAEDEDDAAPAPDPRVIAREALARGARPREAARQVSDATGLDASAAYRVVLAARGDEPL